MISVRRESDVSGMSRRSEMPEFSAISRNGASVSAL
jgi:hypothetical protein